MDAANKIDYVEAPTSASFGNMLLLKQQIGCWLHERWKTEVALAPWLARITGRHWLDLCNRHERLGREEKEARTCLWEDSSLLTVARFFPMVGGRLLRCSIEEWPLLFREKPTPVSTRPEVSVILPVGDRGRLPLFLCVLKGFFGQTVAGIEIIVVEHGKKPEYESSCPAGTRYLFLPMEEDGQFNKSLAMNRAVAMASAPIVLFHDADLIPPAAYVESLLLRFHQGWEAVRPTRFAFHLEQDDSIGFMESNGKYLPRDVEMVQQNNPGLSTAVTMEVYARIGGHDERFEGWGGEDLEFLDRLRTVRLYPGGYAPLIHLWHAPGEKKASGDRNRELMDRLRSIPVWQRIQKHSAGEVVATENR